MGVKNRIAVYSSRHYDSLRSIFSESLLHRCGIRRHWHDIDGWFTWRLAQEEAVNCFPEGSRFVEIGTYLGRSLCSLAEVVEQSGKNITVIGIDTCRGSGPEGWRGKDYHATAVNNGGGTFASTLHKNVMDCGFGEKITLIISDSVSASRLFSDASLDWVHLDARHEPFLDAGIPAVDMIQLSGYPYWHKADDDFDKISADSMKIVGDTVLASLPRIVSYVLANGG